jgi:hypothetical protein
LIDPTIVQNLPGTRRSWVPSPDQRLNIIGLFSMVFRSSLVPW